MSEPSVKAIRARKIHEIANDVRLYLTNGTNRDIGACGIDKKQLTEYVYTPVTTDDFITVKYEGNNLFITPYYMYWMAYMFHIVDDEREKKMSEIKEYNHHRESFFRTDGEDFIGYGIVYAPISTLIALITRFKRGEIDEEIDTFVDTLEFKIGVFMKHSYDGYMNDLVPYQSPTCDDLFATNERFVFDMYCQMCDVWRHYTWEKPFEDFDIARMDDDPTYPEYLEMIERKCLMVNRHEFVEKCNTYNIREHCGLYEIMSTKREFSKLHVTEQEIINHALTDLELITMKNYMSAKIRLECFVIGYFDQTHLRSKFTEFYCTDFNPVPFITRENSPADIDVNRRYFIYKFPPFTQLGFGLVDRDRNTIRTHPDFTAVFHQFGIKSGHKID